MIRFHLDENVDHAIAHGLRLRGIDVTTTTDADLVGASDEVQFKFALSQGRVLFTHDADFLRQKFTARTNHTGIVYCPQEPRSIGHIVRSLAEIAHVLDSDDMRNRVDYL